MCPINVFKQLYWTQSNRIFKPYILSKGQKTNITKNFFRRNILSYIYLEKKSCYKLKKGFFFSQEKKFMSSINEKCFLWETLQLSFLSFQRTLQIFRTEMKSDPISGCSTYFIFEVGSYQFEFILLRNAFIRNGFLLNLQKFVSKI